MFQWREREPGDGARWGVDWGFTDRTGGVSRAPYDSLNLGPGVGDDPDLVAVNRHRLAAELGLQRDDLRFMAQQHGTTIVPVGVGRDGDPPPSADGLVTASPQVALVVLVADCTPVLLVDREVGLAAAVHAGRQGMTGGVVAAAVAALRDRGAHRLQAVVGPSVCARCYEVPEEMRAEAAAVTSAAHGVSRDGTPAIDVSGAVVAQLHEEGIDVRWLPGCTREEPRFFSHRRDGRTGRCAGVVRLLPPEGAA